MEDKYLTEFQLSSPRDVAFIRRLLETIDFSKDKMKLSMTIETENPLPISDILEIKHDNTDLDVLFSSDKDDMDAEISPEDAPSFKEDSSTPIILTEVIAVDGTWSSLSEIRSEIPDSADIDDDNLSGLLWSLADNGYLEKRKRGDGGLNEYKVSKLGRAGLNKLNRRTQAETTSS